MIGATEQILFCVALTLAAKSATIGRNDTRLASQGFVRALRNAPFIGGPRLAMLADQNDRREPSSSSNSCMCLVLRLVHLTQEAKRLQSRE